ncbi:MAG: glycosyltransferase [Planctomycetaceae bacterium]|nr:glycosyltransferase [Planctomycetaceae bacterium]
MIRRATGKVDLHLHSYASNVTDYYAANRFAIPESYSDPFELYHRLKALGMSLVTLTDHNSIDGAKALLDAGYRDVFLSAEMTTTFPEDGCNIHVTVANITEDQFAEVNRLRSNIYEMLDYVEREIALEELDPSRNKIGYFMTHPLMSTQNRPYGREGALTRVHIEKALLLCNTLEGRNGTRTRLLNEFTERMLRSIDKETIERLANRHNIEPRGTRPWHKAIVAGSDDHSGINPGRTFTEFPLPLEGAVTANHLVQCMRDRRVGPEGNHGGPVTLAHAMLKLLHDGNAPKRRVRGARTVRLGGAVESLLGLVFDGGAMGAGRRLALKGRIWLGGKTERLRRSRGARQHKTFESALETEVYRMLRDDSIQERLDALDETDDRIFLVVSTLLNRLFASQVSRIAAAGPEDMLRALKEAVALASSNLLVSLPYLVSYMHQSSDRQIVSDVRKAFDLSEPPRIVLVTDTFFDVNGVARTVRRMMREAERRGIDLVVVTCMDAGVLAPHLEDPEVAAWVAAGRLRVLQPVLSTAFPQYEGLHLNVPPFLELLRYLQESGFHRMQISTPGPLGVAALLAAKLLQIETSATYHTSFPEYVENYTRDISLEALTWKYMILFYHSVDDVVVPSRYIARLLHARGLRKRKLLVLDRWVDTVRFHPAKRDRNVWAKYGVPHGPDQVLFVYVGRVSLEKNLGLLAEAYRRLRSETDRAHLVIVGDGPYRAELERTLEGVPASFLGFVEGEELSCVLASADAKLFPSTTDTWGNAPLEAQASGLPVVVSDTGGPQELMQHGVTGLRVAGRDVDGLLSAMRTLLDDRLRRAMGDNARAFTEAHRIDEPFSAILDAENYRRRVKAGKSAVRASGPEDEFDLELIGMDLSRPDVPQREMSLR